MLAVTDGDGNVLETYTHGADLSGQVGGGAGGIGGILASTQAGGAAHYHYDFNGNVVNVSSSNQTQLAKYTYGPFGEVLLKDGSFDSRYQFSTKEYDLSTGLNYYGYRFYSPGLGRWVNRDPIGETGGVNIYCFSMGNPISNYDYIGLIRRWVAEGPERVIWSGWEFKRTFPTEELYTTITGGGGVLCFWSCYKDREQLGHWEYCWGLWKGVTYTRKYGREFVKEAITRGVVIYNGASHMFGVNCQVPSGTCGD